MTVTDATVPMLRPRLERRLVHVIASLAMLWAAAVLVTMVVRPSLLDARLVARYYAFVAFQLATFRFHWGASALVVGLVLLLRRHRAAALLLMAAAIVGVAPEVRHAWPAHDTTAAGGRPLRVMNLNNHGEIGNVDRVAQLITEQAPDFISFQELTLLADQRLRSALGDAMPYRLAYPQSAARGIALYSRWPLAVTLPPDNATAHDRYFVVEADVEGRTVRLNVVHFLTPQSVALVAGNRRGVGDCVGRLAPLDRPTIVIGDCNFPLAAQQTDAFRAAGLRHVDDVAGRGLRWTWMPKKLFPITRIDHAFVSPDIGVVDSRVLPDVGSDHRPIVVDLRMP